MIERLLVRARGAGARGADAIERRTETTTLTFEAGRLKSGTVTAERGVNLRVLVEGRVGVAGSTAADPTPVVDAALESARLGEEVALTFPGAGPLPAVRTDAPAAHDAPLDALEAMGHHLVERLAGPGRQIGVTVEREIGETTIVNSAGREDTYRTTQVAAVAEVTRVADDDVLMAYDYYLGVDLPTTDQLDTLAADLGRRLADAEVVVDPPEGALPVLFSPHGLAAVLLPVVEGLQGKAVLQGVSPLADRLGEQVFDASVTLTDDPLADGAPASRPLDDEGVASRRLPLIDAGVVRHFIYDLETATRAGRASTGHGTRGIFGKPRPGYSNLRLSGGKRPRADLLAEMRDGLVVDELIGVGQGNVAGGAFSHPVALAYRVSKGEVVGRVKDAAVAGNSFELLARIGGLSSELRWLGTRQVPWILLEGVSVAAR